MIIRVATLVLLVVALSKAAGAPSERSFNIAQRDIHSTRDNSASALEDTKALDQLLKRSLYSEPHFNDRTEAAVMEDAEEAEERWRQDILEAQRLRMQSQIERSRGH